jgi:hypothetical protein
VKRNNVVCPGPIRSVCGLIGRTIINDQYFHGADIGYIPRNLMNNRRDMFLFIKSRYLNDKLQLDILTIVPPVVTPSDSRLGVYDLR